MKGRIPVPKGIDIAAVFGEKLADRAAHFLHTVFGKYAIRNCKKKRGDEPDMVPVSSRMSRRLYGRRQYEGIRRACLDRGLVATDNEFRTKDHPRGAKCKCYAPVGDDWEVGWHEMEDEGLLELSSRPRVSIDSLSPVDKKMVEHLDRLSYHPAAPKVAGSDGSLMRRYGQVTVLNRIDRGEHVYSVGPVSGRVTNTLCGASRNVRKHLRIAGLPAVSVDLSCCQPALLGAMLTSHGQIRSLGESMLPPPPMRGVHRFAEDASNGRLYDILVEQSGVERGRLKRAFMSSVLAKKGRCNERVETAFATLYPEVHRYICEANSADHSKVIVALQRAESWLVRNFITPRVVDVMPVITVYDAFFCPITYEAELLAGVRDGLEEARVSMLAKIEIPDVPGLERYSPRLTAV